MIWLIRRFAPATRVIVVLLAVMAFGGCKKQSTVSRPVSPQLHGDAEINKWLAEALAAHQIPAHVAGDWVVCDDRRVSFNGELSDDRAAQNGHIVQAEMRVRIGDSPTITQSVVGMGKDRAAAIENSKASFLLGTFHCWIGAFVDANDEHVVRQEWTINGRKQMVTLGDVVTKSAGGEPPEEDGWRQELRRRIEASDMLPGVHWVDVYHGQIKNHGVEMQIERDGVRWMEMEQMLRDAKWPFNGTFTSVRLFLVIQDEGDRTRPASRAAK